MGFSNKKFVVESFTIQSASEVAELLEKLARILPNHPLIHISSYMHNTVLVQNLKREIEKEFPNIPLVLLKNECKTHSTLTLFGLYEPYEASNLRESELLQELVLEHERKSKTIDGYRNKLLKRYFKDHLTNLPNLYQLRKDLEMNEEYGLILIKIDNFATINNFYGFMVGDFVIESVAGFLKERLRYDTYRISGSEFALTIKQKMGFYELKEELSNIYDSIKNMELHYQQSPLYINFTLASSAQKDNASIFSKVSMALAFAKKKGVAFWIYEDRMNFENEYARNLELSLIVRDGIFNAKVIPYYQAIMDNKTGKISKYECLARMRDKNEKVLSPLLFIPIAKRIKLYNAITKSIINSSFELFESNELEFSVNLSIDDVMSSEIFTFIIEKLKSSNAAPRVTFELLESEAVQDFKRVERFINEVKRYGAKIAIDDFGSGYSNFAYLTKMQADYIKIDGALIENIDVDATALVVVETIVTFAKKLGIKTVAEYVHSSLVLEKVKMLGIDYSQGFYIDEPSLTLK